MSNLFETFSLYFSFPFVRYALITGTLIALCSSLLGVTLVLRRFSYIGDGLSHVAFGAMSFAAVFGLTNDMLIVLPMTIACAILLLCGGARARLGGTRLEPDRRVGVRPRQAEGPREDIPLHPPQSREVGEEVSEKTE